MNTYLIGYDLNKPGQGYTELINALKGYGTYWRHLDSTWIIKSNKTAVQIRDFLLNYIDASDELLVVELTGTAAWYGFSEKGANWLLKNLQPS